MNRVYEMDENQKAFDITAMKIFISAIAILLSVFRPNALATAGNFGSYQPTTLNKIILDFKNQDAESIWPIYEKKASCNLQNGNSALNQSANLHKNFDSGYKCPLPISQKQPDGS